MMVMFEFVTDAKALICEALFLRRRQAAHRSCHLLKGSGGIQSYSQCSTGKTSFSLLQR